MIANHPPEVSVIVTVYKRTEYLREALQSILAQTVTDFELIVTDDSNSPAVRSICDEFAFDRRVRYRANPITLGAPLNVAAAMNEATGEYATIFNDDDLMEPFMFEKLLPPLRRDATGIASFGDHWITNAAGEPQQAFTDNNSVATGRKKLAEGRLSEAFSFAIRGGIPLVMGTLFRRSLFLKEWMRPEVAGAYDQWLAICLARLPGAIYYVDARVAKWRTHEKSETARTDANKVACNIYVYSRVLEENLSPSDRRMVESKLGSYWFVLGRDRMDFGRNAQATEAFRHSLRHRISASAAAGWLLSKFPKRLVVALLDQWRKARGIVATVPNAK